MKRTIPLMTVFLLASAMAAAAQSSGPISGFSAGITSGSVSSGVLSGAGSMYTGFDVQVTADSGSRVSGQSDPFAARDGCTNIPNQAHNSADCSRIIAWDPNWVLPDKPVSEMSGAEENMLRNWRILTRKPLPERYR